MESTLADLPDEIWVKVLLNLPWKFILVAQQVNQRFCELIRESKAIQYAIELGCAGMVDGQTSSTVEERHEKLLKYQTSWMRLKSNRRQLIQLPEGPIWELAGGVLAQGIPSTPGSFDVHKIVFTRLARGARGPLDEMQWEYGNSEFEIRDFTMDPSQDLAVFISTPPPDDLDKTAKIILRFFSLTTFQKHPKANSSILVHELNASLALRCSNIQQLCANYICVLHSAQFNVTSEELILWDWVSGEMKFRLTKCMIHSFSFATPKHLLLALNLGLDTDTSDEYEHPVRLVICDVEATAAIAGNDKNQEGQKEYAATCVLDLPPMDPYADIVEILIRSDPAPSGLEQSQDPSAMSVPFHLAPRERIFVINISVYPADDMDEDGDRSEYINLALFVPLSTLLTHIASASQPEIIMGCGSLDAPFAVKSAVQIRWDAWLPRGSRMLVLPNEERVWVCNVYGSRFIYALQSAQADGEPEPRRFAVMDFNPHSTQRAIAAAGDVLKHKTEFPPEQKDTSTAADSIEASHVEWSCEPTVLHARKYNVFTENVTTYLPFQQSFSRNAFVFDGLLLTEDNILLVKASHIHLHSASNFVL